MTGAAALASLVELYDVAGQIRAALVELQTEVGMTMRDRDAQGR